MSVSHAESAPTPRRHQTQPVPEENQGRTGKVIFGLMGVVLLGVLAMGVIGLLTTVPNPSHDIRGYLVLSHMSILWLWVCGMDIAAILGYLVAWAFQA